MGMENAGKMSEALFPAPEAEKSKIEILNMKKLLFLLNQYQVV